VAYGAQELARMEAAFPGAEPAGGMTLDEMRALRRRADPNSVDNINAERPCPGPQAEGGTAVSVEQTVDGETFAGTVTMAKPATKTKGK
jgi:hypothetical protein